MVRHLKDLGLRIQGLSVWKLRTLETGTSKIHMNTRNFPKPTYFVRPAYQNCHILVCIIPSLCILWPFAAEQDITTLYYVWFFHSPDMPSGKSVICDDIDVKNQHNTQLCFELVGEVEVKGLPHLEWEKRFCVGRHFLWDVIPASLHPKKDVLHWSPQAQGFGKTLLHHLINSPCCCRKPQHWNPFHTLIHLHNRKKLGFF